jgi:hypothetical protein
VKAFEIGMALGVTIGAFGMGGVAACTARETAKSEYELQSKSCVNIYDGNAPAQKSCLEYVRNKWNAAGARPAATDGGDQ